MNLVYSYTGVNSLVCSILNTGVLYICILLVYKMKMLKHIHKYEYIILILRMRAIILADP